MAWLERRRAKDASIKWFVYWREGGRGSPKKCVKAGTRKRHAERLASEIEYRVNAGLIGAAVIARRVTFAEFADEWLTLRMVRPTTLRRDRSLIDTYLNPSFGGMLLSRITVEDILKLLRRVTQERSAGTSRRMLAVLGRMLRDAQKRDYIFQNPFEKLDRWDKPRTRRKPQVMNLHQLMRVLRSVPLRWTALCLFATLTGLRWSEIVSLEWSDIDFDEWKIRVRRAMPAGADIFSDPKSFASIRYVDMLWPVRLALLNTSRGGNLVFPGMHGGLLNHGWFSRRIWIPAARTGGIHYRFHDLRHTFASLLLAWGETLLYVSQQLGHSRADFTLISYAHLIRQGSRLNKEEVLRQLFNEANRPRDPFDREPCQLTLPWGT